MLLFVLYAGLVAIDKLFRVLPDNQTAYSCYDNICSDPQSRRHQLT